LGTTIAYSIKYSGNDVTIPGPEDQVFKNRTTSLDVLYFRADKLYAKKRRCWFMLIHLNTLNQMFEDIPDRSRLTVESCCRSCGCNFTIEIHHHSSGGYGLLGGVLYEQDVDRLIAKCDDCYHQNHQL